MFKVSGGFKNADKPMTIRFTEKLHFQLGKLAQDRGISFNTLVLQCCKYALENLDKEDDKND